jgi:hypothetical protein
MIFALACIRLHAGQGQAHIGHFPLELLNKLAAPSPHIARGSRMLAQAAA